MRKTILLALACTALAACSSDAVPTGQVVATVDGVEITQADITAELRGINPGANVNAKELQSLALGSIIDRMLIANAAEEQGAGGTPEAALAKRRAEQMTLAGLLEERLGANVPEVTAEEATNFVNDNPAMFSQRRIMMVEQIIVPSPPQDLIAKLEPLQTLADVQRVLGAQNLPTRISYGVIDAVQMNPDVVRQIVNLPADEVFMMPTDGSLRINRIRETQTVPIPAQEATAIAKEILTEGRVRQQVTSAFQKIVQEGRGSVVYSEAFKPKAQSKAQSKAQPKPAAGAAPQ